MGCPALARHTKACDLVYAELWEQPCTGSWHMAQHAVLCGWAWHMAQHAVLCGWAQHAVLCEWAQHAGCVGGPSMQYYGRARAQNEGVRGWAKHTGLCWLAQYAVLPARAQNAILRR